jgi:hypothetical protein
MIKNEVSKKVEHSGRLLFRRIISVVAGFVTIVVLSVGTDAILKQMGVLPYGALFDTRLLLLALAYRSFYSVIGCYIAARLAPDWPMGHALALGLVGVIVSAIGTVVAWDLGPAWYGLALVVLALPLAWLGGKLYALNSERVAHKPKESRR